MQHVAIIPARAGSKSVIDKNLQEINGKSLVSIAASLTKKATFMDMVYLSTDIESLSAAHYSTNYFKFIKRPKALATDQATMADVVLDLIKSQLISINAYIWLIQPTSPFRCLHDFFEIKNLLQKYEPMSVISVVDVGPNHPNRMYTVKEAELLPLRHNNFDNKQDLINVYLRNGCFYVVKCEEFLKHKTFYLKTCISYLMPKERSVNIDDEHDLMWARMMAKYQ